MYHLDMWTHWAFGIGESQLNKHTTTTRLLKVTAIGAVLLASLGVAGTTAAGKPAPAPSGTVTWAGNGTTVSDGTLTLTDGDACDIDNTPYLLWVLAGSKATAASITITGSLAVSMEKTNVDKKGFSSFKYEMPGPINLDSLGPVVATYDDGKNKATLTISHGCLGGNDDVDPCLEVEADDLTEECDVDPCLEVDATDLTDECDVDPCLEVDATDLTDECDVDPCLEVDTTDLTDECDVDPCLEVPSLAAGGSSPVLSSVDLDVVVSDGDWTDIAGCSNTFTYQWQYIFEGDWEDYPGLTSSAAAYEVLYFPFGDDGDVPNFARARVTATNAFGSTTVESDELQLNS
jgi:hypothetical protein